MRPKGGAPSGCGNRGGRVVKVLIRREIQEGKAREVFALLDKLREDVVHQKGDIYDETLFDYDNPNEIIVIGMWRDAMGRFCEQFAKKQR